MTVDVKKKTQTTPLLRAVCEYRKISQKKFGVFIKTPTHHS